MFGAKQRRGLYQLVQAFEVSPSVLAQVFGAQAFEVSPPQPAQAFEQEPPKLASAWEVSPPRLAQAGGQDVVDLHNQ